MNSQFLITVISILAAALRMMIPLGYAAIGGAISERSGIIALGLEGYMTIGAFFAVLGSYIFQSAGMGLLFAGLAGGLFAGVFGFMCIRFKADQTVGGLGMNTIAPGLVAVLMVSIFGNKGKSDMVPALSEIQIPGLKSIPVLRDLLDGQTILFYALIITAVTAYIVFYHTPAGIRLRSTGTNPEVIDSLGLSAKGIQYCAVIASGILAGIGGAYLSIGQLNFYSMDMVAGRGYIAIAVFVFANWNPALCMGTALLFACAEALQMRLQTLGMPSQIIQMIPYVCTLIVLLNVKKKRRIG